MPKNIFKLQKEVVNREVVFTQRCDICLRTIFWDSLLTTNFFRRISFYYLKKDSFVTQIQQDSQQSIFAFFLVGLTNNNELFTINKI